MTFAALMNVSDAKVSWLQQSRVLGAAIMPLLNALVIENQLFLRLHHVPTLYQSGTRYREEPPTIVTFSDGTVRPVEEFACAAIVLGRLWGDCDDLAPFRCAELRNRGEQATIRLQWKKQPSGRKLYHVVLRRPPNIPDFNPNFMVRVFTNVKGRKVCTSIIEDPSRALGMPSSMAVMHRDAYLA